MFTSVYICLLSVWGCCDWYIHLHGGFESGRLDLMNVRVFWKEQRLCISMRIISTVSVSSNTIAVCIRYNFKLADSHQLQKLDLQILFAVNIVRLYWLKHVACP